MYLQLAIKALVWFATHFREVAKIMGERNGVVNLHLAVDVSYRHIPKGYKMMCQNLNLLKRVREGTSL